jgi:NAD(P)-dependent dehydrogenase (short-subunit alcohol dehydrogenase family)
MIEFKNQVAIITGAGRGMGREIALELARRAWVSIWTRSVIWPAPST